MINIREMTVLIADDMENMINSIRSIMRILKFGRIFKYAQNGEDALKILRQEKVDLALLDNNMPGISGVELLEIIREDRVLRDMPVIMITANATMEYITSAAESEIDAYLLKPITVELLKSKIPDVVDKANNPLPMVFHLKKASRFAEEDDLDSAVQQAIMAKEANPKSSKPLREIGYYLLKKEDFAEAESCLVKAAKMNPIDVVAFNMLGDLYLKQNDIDNALKFLDKAIKISPRHFKRGLNLGKILIQKKMGDKAAKVLKKVFELSKNPAELKEEIADFCIENGVRELAHKLLKDLLIKQKNRPDLHYKLGLILEETGKAEEALACFTESASLDEKNIEAIMHTARIYLDQGKILRAENPLKAVLKIDPENKEAKDLLRQCI